MPSGGLFTGFPSGPGPGIRTTGSVARTGPNIGSVGPHSLDCRTGPARLSCCRTGPNIGSVGPHSLDCRTVPT